MTAIAVIALIAGISAIVLGWAAMYLHVEGDPVVDQIDALLPQTQCGQCDFSGCRPYAQAMASGEAAINRCPPGGASTIKALANLLDQEAMPLNPEHGIEKPPMVAVIDEQVCIGCTLCIQDCPVDAILGAAKVMHTVIASECTGCDLCIAPCPVDCIAMVPLVVAFEAWRWPEPGREAEDHRGLAA